MPTQKRKVLLKTAGICGVVNPILVLSLILLAISMSPSFNWTQDALSDLGVDGLTAVLFNFSLVVGGILTFVFAVGIKEIFTRKALGLVGASTLMLDATALCATGIFPETVKPTHFYASLAFFVLLPISLFLVGAAMLKEFYQRKLGLFTVFAGIVSAVVWLFPRNGVAIPEMVAALSASVWSVVVGVKLLQQSTFLDANKK